MADIISILLKARIDDGSIGQIQDQINNIQNKAKPVEIKVDTTKSTQNVKNITSSFEKLEEVTKKNLSLDLDRLSNRYKNLVKPTDIAQVRGMIDSLKFDDPKLGHNIDLVKVKMKELSVGAEQSRKSLDLANKSSMSLGESIKTAGQKFMIWSGVTVAYFGFVRAVKSGIITVKDLDTAMVELKKVTDETEETYNKFTETAFKLGKELSRTGIEVVQATSDFARMGYDIKQATDLAYEALLMLNVGDGIDSVDEATSSIIATLKGFRIEGEETTTVARHINDAFNEVANNFAVDTGSLAEGVKRTSAVLNQAGNSFEETVGMLTGAYEVIQNMPKASSGVNIITQRLKAMDEEGNEIKGLAPKLEKAFNDIGLSLYDTNGELKKTYENLGALAEVFPRLTKEQQNYISELVSGKRQSVVLMSLMSNWESVEEAVISATNSTGSAMAENEKYLNSIEGKVANFTSTVQMFWNTAINSNAIKSIVDFGTSLMEHLIDLTNKFGIFGNALGIIIPLIGIKYVLAVTNATKATIQQKLTSDLLGNSTISLLNGFKLLIGQLFGVKTAADGAKISFLGLNAAAGIISVTLAAIPMIIGAIATAEDKRKRALEESIEAFKRQQEISTNTNDLISSYEELANKTKLTTEEQEKLFNIKGKIKELLPESKTYLDNENLSLKEQVEIVKELNEKELERLELEAHKQVSRGSRTYEDEKKELENLIALLGEWKEKQKELSQKFFDKTISQDELSIYKEISEKTPELQKKIDKLTDSTETYKSAIDFLTNGIQDNSSTVDENTDAMENNNSTLESQLQSTTELYNGVAEAVDEYEVFKMALQELDKEGSLSQETISKLIAINEDFIDVTGLEADELRKLLNQSAETRRGYIDDEIAKAQQTKASTLERLNMYKTEAEALQALALARNVTARMNSGMSTGDAELDQKVRQNNENLINEISIIEEANKKIKALQNMKYLYDRADKKVAGKGSKKSGSKSKSKSTKDKPNFIDPIDAEIRAIKNKNDNLEKSNELLREQLDLAKDIEGIEGLNKQYEINGKLIENNKKLLKSYKNEQTLLHDKANNLRNKNKKYNIDSWFDANGEQTQAYANQYDKLSKKEQENMDKVFQQMQKYKKAWMDSDKEAKNVVNTIRKLERETASLVIQQEEMVKSKVRELIEAEKQNAYLDLERRQRIANEELKRAKQEMEDKVKSKQSEIDDIQKEIDDIQESERARAENLERAKRLEEISKLQNKYYALQYQNLSDLTEEQAKALDLEKEREQYLERQAKIQELLIKLENIRNEKNIQQLTKKKDGTWDFEYVADQKEIDDINKQVEDLQKEHGKTLTDLKERTLEDLKQKQEDYDEWERQNDIRRQIEEKQRRIQRYQDEIQDLQDRYAEKERITNEAFAAERENLDRYYTDIDLLTDEKMKELYGTFDGNWEEIYGMLAGYFDDIRREYEGLIDTLSQPISLPEFEGGGNGGGSGGGDYGYYDPPSGGTSFSGSNKNTDWSKMYMDARAKGDYKTMEHANRQANIERGKGNVVTSDKDIEAIKKKIRGYSTGIEQGLVTKDHLAMLHGDKTNWEGVFTKDQLSKLLKSAVLSTVNLVTPTVPKVALAGAGGGDIKQNINIDKLEFPNVKDAREIEGAIKNLSTFANQWANRK